MNMIRIIAWTQVLGVLVTVLISVSVRPLTIDEENFQNLFPKNYDAGKLPPKSVGDTVNVTLSVYLNELMAVDDAAQNIQADLIIVQEWIDSRLSSPDNRSLTISNVEQIRKFWLPDLYLINGQQTSLVDALQEQRKLTIHGGGRLYYAQRINTIVQCPMNLALFPQDYQYCYFRFSSVKYNQKEMAFTLQMFDVFNKENTKFKIRLHYRWQSCRPDENPLPTHTCVVATIKLVRYLSYYIIRYYLLTFLTIIISFVGFWIPVNGWPARVFLMTTPLLNLISQDIAINNEIKINYVTAFHWWMMCIQAFIYLELVEYALAVAWANFINDKKKIRAANAKQQQQQQKQQQTGRTNRETVNPPPDQSPEKTLKGYFFGNNNWYKKIGQLMDQLIHVFFGQIDHQTDPYVRNKVDYVSRILFPSVFLLFVLIYILACVVPWAANFN